MTAPASEPPWYGDRLAFERLADSMARAFSHRAAAIPRPRTADDHVFVTGGAGLIHLIDQIGTNGKVACSCFCDMCLRAGKCVCPWCDCDAYGTTVHRPKGLHHSTSGAYTTYGMLHTTIAMEGLLTVEDPYEQDHVPSFYPNRNPQHDEWKAIRRANGVVD